MKAIVSHLESIEEMAGMDVLCSDKTGTLTENRLTLGEPALFAAADAHELVLAAALASKEEDRDAIDLAVLAGLDGTEDLRSYRQRSFVPFDPVRKRTDADVETPDGRTITVTKGAPQAVMDLCRLDAETAARVTSKVEEFAARGYRTLGVARTVEGRNEFLGLLPLFDPPREDSAETIRRAQEHGIGVKMVTGDDLAIAKEIAGRLGLGTAILAARTIFPAGIERPPSAVADRVAEADGFARVFPEHKFEIVRALQSGGHIVGMTHPP
jgi:H+-transporting ATPase